MFQDDDIRSSAKLSSSVWRHLAFPTTESHRLSVCCASASFYCCQDKKLQIFRRISTLEIENIVRMKK
jgi:hypothetical protein